jgi:hypothetical protein
MAASFHKNPPIQADPAFMLSTVSRTLVSTFDKYNIGRERGTVIGQKCFVAVPLEFFEYLESLGVKSGISDILPMAHLVYHLTRNSN